MYNPPDKHHWTGRTDSISEVDSFRLHQKMLCKPIPFLSEKESAYCIIGFESDEGVRRNKGRPGAAKAPNEVRKLLANLPFHIANNTTLLDVGNVSCDEEKLEQAQEELGECINKILSSSSIPIIIGGGHETLYGHYLGVRQHIGEKKTLGIVNIDAHFDMRKDKTPSSGTMFSQILERDSGAGYLCLGIQPFSNTESLFKEAERLGCQYVLEEDLTVQDSEKTRMIIDSFCRDHDVIILTLCMDSISSSYAPGVSAPSPFGLDQRVVRDLIRYIVSKENTHSFDISEVNPVVDEKNMTSRLAALLIGEAIKNFNRKHLQ